jgi:cytoskeletal protein CcmA (bactofilin family)
MVVNYFAHPKAVRETTPIKDTGSESARVAAPAKVQPDTLSTIGHGVLITGDIVCAGALHIFGAVTGDVHARQVIIGNSGRLEGKIIAQEAVVEGVFTGTVHANSVKLQGRAKVNGEVFNKSLVVEQDALFEGVSRRLERPVEPPSADQVNGAKAARVAPSTPASEPLMLTRPVHQPIPLSEVVI